MKKQCNSLDCAVFFDDAHPITIVDAKQDSKEWQFLEMPLMRANHVNLNGNFYPYDLAADAVKAFKEDMVATNTAFMELDHPDWGKGKAGQPAHIAGMLVDVWWDENDAMLLMGKAKLFDTDAGKTIRAIIDGGGRIGVSQRAFGLVDETEDDGKIIRRVIANYDIVGFDFVGHPATKGMRAGDKTLFEGRQDMKTYTEDEVKKLLEDKEKEVLDAAEAEMEAKVLEKAQELADEMFNDKLEEAVTEKLEDAAAEKAKELFDAQLEEFKKSMKLEDAAADSLKEELAQKDTAIKELQDKLTKMELDSFIDSELAGYKYRDKVLEIIGEVASIEDAKAAIDKAKSFIESLVDKKAPEDKDEPIEDKFNMDMDKALQRRLAGLE